MDDERRQDRQGVLILVACALALMLGLGVALLLTSSEPRLDPVSLRAVNRPSTGVASVLIDRTDPLSALQEARIKDRLRQLELHELRANDFVEVWELRQTDEGPLRRLFARYFPGRDANPLWANPSAVASRSDSLFWTPLLDALRPPVSGHVAHSPILSAVRELSEQSEFSAAKSRRTLLLISDLLENSDAGSFYAAREDFRAFRVSAAYLALRPDLRGANVEVCYVVRPDLSPAASERARCFWQAYFRASGAAVITFERL